jgi:two-component system, LuxR family, response regulator FixJ
MANKPTVFVVDDDAGALRSLSWLIQQADLPVRVFPSGREFLESYHADDAGCLVLDVRMPELDGLEVQRRLRERHSGLPVIFVTAHGDVPTCTQALKAGALDFLEKPVDGEVLLDHVRDALDRDAQRRAFASRLSQLTPSETEVLDMLISGKSLKAIAAASNVTVQTIWKHRLNVYKKMGVENDVGLVRLAAQWEYQGRQ